MTELLLIRHGQTAGNLRREYIGQTDEPLCPAGVGALREHLAGKRYPEADMVFVSPLLRCRQTAAIIYPQLSPLVIDDFRECDFGAFEHKNYQDLSGSVAYQEWVASGGELPFPGGESRAEFAARCIRGFEQVAELILYQHINRAALVVHGGTIMALLASYTGRGYYDFMTENGGGWRVWLDRELWRQKRLPEPERLF
ncbi:MAG TPA: histidine phosphatase family protein [Candidatus Avidehalobacter gallistercoris]|uniref:Histidine phosphatase family protein n=1 Tax=Candidatus Avidehalobacter gallistercoris TaxID=2840694 RepID=A0A9D1HK12_9FIRM|nr:histidine phosphatase family protein [Candidatus Avidehalobacter gallistercoris]